MNDFHSGFLSKGPEESADGDHDHHLRHHRRHNIHHHHWLWSSGQVGTVSYAKVQTLRTPDAQPAIAMEGGSRPQPQWGGAGGNPHHREPQGGGGYYGVGGGGGAQQRCTIYMVAPRRAPPPLPPPMVSYPVMYSYTSISNGRHVVFSPPPPPCGTGYLLRFCPVKQDIPLLLHPLPHRRGFCASPPPTVRANPPPMEQDGFPVL